MLEINPSTVTCTAKGEESYLDSILLLIIVKNVTKRGKSGNTNNFQGCAVRGAPQLASQLLLFLHVWSKILQSRAKSCSDAKILTQPTRNTKTRPGFKRVISLFCLGVSVLAIYFLKNTTCKLGGTQDIQLRYEKGNYSEALLTYKISFGLEYSWVNP